MTTGDYTSAQLAAEEVALSLPTLDNTVALALGEIAVRFGCERSLPIATQVRIGDWIVFHASLPGTDTTNDQWMARKARVVALTGHSSLHERTKAEEDGIDWYSVNNAPEESHAIHGGGLPIMVSGQGQCGTLLISGLPQLDDHLLGVEILTEYLKTLTAASVE